MAGLPFSKGASEYFFCRTPDDGGRFALIKHDGDDGSNLTVQFGSIIKPDARFQIRFQDDFSSKCENDFEIVGSFDGLLCLSFSSKDSRPSIILWNPSIRRHVVLPPPPILPQMKGCLGFCVAGDGDHKVVRILRARAVTVEVYSLNSGEWRKLAFDQDLYPRRTFWSGQAFVEGRMHWIGYDKDASGDCTMVTTSFGIDDEKFQDIAFPDKIRGLKDREKLWVSVVKGGLGMLQLRNYLSGYIWMMEVYGNAKSWTRLYSFKLPFGKITNIPLSFSQVHVPLADAVKAWKNADVLTSTSHGLANAVPRRCAKVVGHYRGHLLAFVAKYVETPVLLGNPNAVSD